MCIIQYAVVCTSTEDIWHADSPGDHEQHLEHELRAGAGASTLQATTAGNADVAPLQRRPTCKSQLQRRIRSFGVHSMRWLLHVRQHGHMAAGLLNLGYEIGYLLRMSPYFSPAHHISGVVLIRDDGSRAVRSCLLVLQWDVILCLA